MSEVFDAPVTFAQRINYNQKWYDVWQTLRTADGKISLCVLSGAELGNAVDEPRHLAARAVLVHHATLRRPHEVRLGKLHGRQCLGPITRGYRLFHLANIGPHP